VGGVGPCDVLEVFDWNPSEGWLFPFVDHDLWRKETLDNNGCTTFLFGWHIGSIGPHARQCIKNHNCEKHLFSIASPHDKNLVAKNFCTSMQAFYGHGCKIFQLACGHIKALTGSNVLLCCAVVAIKDIGFWWKMTMAAALCTTIMCWTQVTVHVQHTQKK